MRTLRARRRAGPHRPRLPLLGPARHRQDVDGQAPRQGAQLRVNGPDGHALRRRARSAGAIHDATALDVIEMDAASHRGIDDMRELRRARRARSRSRGATRSTSWTRRTRSRRRPRTRCSRRSRSRRRTSSSCSARPIRPSCCRTIRSRCQRFAFRRPGPAELVTVLRARLRARGASTRRRGRAAPGRARRRRLLPRRADHPRPARRPSRDGAGRRGARRRRARRRAASRRSSTSSTSSRSGDAGRAAAAASTRWPRPARTWTACSTRCSGTCACSTCCSTPGAAGRPRRPRPTALAELRAPGAPLHGRGGAAHDRPAGRRRCATSATAASAPAARGRADQGGAPGRQRCARALLARVERLEHALAGGDAGALRPRRPTPGARPAPPDARPRRAPAAPPAARAPPPRRQARPRRAGAVGSDACAAAPCRAPPPSAPAELDRSRRLERRPRAAHRPARGVLSARARRPSRARASSSKSRAPLLSSSRALRRPARRGDRRGLRAAAGAALRGGVRRRRRRRRPTAMARSPRGSCS